MLLATYQPLEQHVGYDNQQSEIVKMLGYKPIWCISAETIEEFLCQSYFCAPNYGEELIVFESEEYDTVDKCKWYNALKNGEKKLDVDWVNLDCKFKEYMVQRIDNIVFRMPMDLRNFAVKFSDCEEINHMVKQIFDFARDAQSKIQMIDKNNRTVPADPYKHPRLFQSYIAINAECGVLAIMYSLMVKHDLFDWMRFRGGVHMSTGIHQRFMNWNNNDCSESGFVQIVDEFYRLFDKSLAVTHRRSQGKIGRNEPCPCGSGKKWKKCCGQRT